MFWTWTHQLRDSIYLPKSTSTILTRQKTGQPPTMRFRFRTKTKLSTATWTRTEKRNWAKKSPSKLWTCSLKFCMMISFQAWIKRTRSEITLTSTAVCPRRVVMRFRTNLTILLKWCSSGAIWKLSQCTQLRISSNERSQFSQSSRSSRLRSKMITFLTKGASSRRSMSRQPPPTLLNHRMVVWVKKRGSSKGRSTKDGSPSFKTGGGTRMKFTLRHKLTLKPTMRWKVLRSKDRSLEVRRQTRAWSMSGVWANLSSLIKLLRLIQNKRSRRSTSTKCFKSMLPRKCSSKSRQPTSKQLELTLRKILMRATLGWRTTRTRSRKFRTISRRRLIRSL